MLTQSIGLFSESSLNNNQLPIADSTGEPSDKVSSQYLLFVPKLTINSNRHRTCSLSSQNYRSLLIINVVYVRVIISSLKLNYIKLFGCWLLSRSLSRTYESLTGLRWHGRGQGSSLFRHFSMLLKQHLNAMNKFIHSFQKQE